ncbi:MAG: hypothetical protein J6K49_09060 [Clostridia bacterium]|nr:hypothetical protein [Clostridia bacterium]MBQ6837800.1 hypothetical protein [Clostridia bacterium]
MSENKDIKATGMDIPTPPPVAPKKKKNTKKIIIPVAIILAIAVVVTAVALIKKGIEKQKEDSLNPVIVTDINGVPVTNQNGEPVTVIPQTEIHTYTDTNGNILTTVVNKEVAVTVPVTNEKGEYVTDKNGEVVTEEIKYVPTTKAPDPIVIGTSSVYETDPSGEVVTNESGEAVTSVVEITTIPATSNSDILGTTAIPMTDGQGNTAVDEDGNVFTTIVELTSNPIAVEPADIEWKASRGGTQSDYISSIAPLKNDGYIAAVVTNSKDGNYKEHSELKYSVPYTVLTKYKKNGDIDWETVVGSKKGMTAITTVVPTDDGGFYAVGYGKNVGGVTGKGYYDGVVYKFDKKGEQEWYKTFGTSTVDLFNGATLTSDGGIIAVGSVGNNDGDAKGFKKPALESAACIVKYSSDGKLLWKNIVGGNQDTFNGVAEASDGNIFVVGDFYSGNLFTALGSSDSAVVKFSPIGEYLDVAPIAGKGIENFPAISACKNGGVVVVGRSNSTDAGSTESFFVADLASRGGYDSYIIKFKNDLSIEFANPFRGQYDDALTSVVEAEDGTFIAAGYSNSSSRDFKGITTRGGDDIVIASFNKFGSLSWARSFGGTKSDSANAICLGSDGGYLVAGKTLSNDIDMKGIAQYVNGKSVGVIVKFPE